MEESNEGAAVSENASNTRVRRQIDLNTTVLLVEDSTSNKLPDYVESILISMDIQHSSQVELLSALVYCIALETGFVSISSIENAKFNNVKLETCWGFSFHSKNLSILNSPSTLLLNDTIKSFHQNSDNIIKHSMKLLNYSKKTLMLIIIQTGDFLIVTFTSEHLSGRSVCLSIPRYVLSIRKSNTSLTKFQNLKELSYLLKDNLFIPIKCQLIHECQSPYPGLTGLPYFELRNLLRYLSLKDIQQLSKTCWRLRHQCISYYNTRIKKPPLSPEYVDR